MGLQIWAKPIDISDTDIFVRQTDKYSIKYLVPLFESNNDIKLPETNSVYLFMKQKTIVNLSSGSAPLVLD